jgi:hypothetical protein
MVQGMLLVQGGWSRPIPEGRQTRTHALPFCFNILVQLPIIDLDLLQGLSTRKC